MNKAVMLCVGMCALTIGFHAAVSGAQSDDDSARQVKWTRYYVTVFPPRDAELPLERRPATAFQDGAHELNYLVSQEQEQPGSVTFTGLSTRAPVVTSSARQDYFIVSWRVREVPMPAPPKVRKTAADLQPVSLVSSQEGLSTRRYFFESLREPQVATKRPNVDRVRDLSPDGRPFVIPRKEAPADELPR